MYIIKMVLSKALFIAILSLSGKYIYLITISHLLFHKPTNKSYTYMLLPLLVDYNLVFWNGLQVHNQKNSEILLKKVY